MSMNLILYFKDSKNRKIQEIDLIQVNTEITFKILELNTFEEQLKAYFEHAKKCCPDDYDREIKHIENIIKIYGDDYKPEFGCE